MYTLLGKAIMEQIAVGYLSFYHRPRPQAQPVLRAQDGWRQETTRFHQARKDAMRQLESFYARARQQVGEAVASIFSIHALMLDDDDYVDTIRNLIQGQDLPAERAVQLAEDQFAATFSSMDSPYMQARAADIRDISQRVIRNLSGCRLELTMSRPGILVTDSFLPSEVMEFDRKRLLGLISWKGSMDSHTSMLMRAYHIPAIVEVDITPKWEGHLALMDGYTGSVYIDPKREQLEQLREQYQANGRPDQRALSVT